MFSRIVELADDYDPYGFMLVSALQALTVALVLFFVYFLFTPYAMESALQLPILGLFTTVPERSFNLKIRNVAVYCLMCMLYSFLLSSIMEYRLLTVFVVGGVVFGLFMLCKYKLPYILGMITLMQVVVYSQLRINYAGNIHMMINYGISFVAVSALGLLIMYLFPRVYFYRVWVRSLYKTIHEFEMILSQGAQQQITLNQLEFNHFFQMHDFTSSLSYRENGWVARKIALLVVILYSHIITLFNRIEDDLDREILAELSLCCAGLVAAIKDEQPLKFIELANNLDSDIKLVQYNFNLLIKYWNQACLKM